ncbi:MAG TPA: VTT domain-containing protein [Rectinemataceae bacterium]|nr:VTT domain-containing protein [Rectinemataceae bacterium]
MHSFGDFLTILLHVDRYLVPLIQQYGALTYLFMFLLIFAETGLVVTPFLPGDSVIFALGALASVGRLDIAALAAVLMSAAVVGNMVNYAIGARLGPAVFSSERSRFFRRDYLDRTHAFYERYGAVTVIVARFMPIIRTFVPFVAGIGRMGYLRFFIYNVIGSVSWVALFLAAGYFFGTLPFVRDHFSTVALGIIAISLLPPAVTALRAYRSSRKTKTPAS